MDTHAPRQKASVPRYLRVAETLGLERMMLVQASIYSTDNTVAFDSLTQFCRTAPAVSQ